MAARLNRVLLLMRDVQAGAEFYGEKGLGLTTRFVAAEYAELVALPPPMTPAGASDAEVRAAAASSFALVLQQVERPVLSFEIDDMDMTIMRLMGLGARLDGPIKYPVEGKVASIRSPDGHMIGLFEPNPDLRS
ncbi:Hypothetical Protein FCC1311_085792 [Hondaea fermentalgiana]|uniref:Uncharacterized protein n=1 Tax=Hondaea fermentalgiana TaxID=2315210 RepID=A0A2R5GWN9_9STRA|nr:Hypothetical Protein FCC1311_085792 [Hondaea fermentalgiana]|eukprot:GBG32354.1 Hypothetical Protein FCC1311_085792 [Hondaea fermentalgiana]